MSFNVAATIPMNRELKPFEEAQRFFADKVAATIPMNRELKRL